MRRSIAFTAALAVASCSGRAVPLSDLPTVRAHNGLAQMTLTAERAVDGRGTFVFDGRDMPPTIRISPGDTLNIHYVNALPISSATHDSPMNMTNLHFHGLSVSPERPQDDVLDMMAMPGEALDYTLTIPRDHLPGLFWYHTHPHGESARQVLDGMSGALIIDGIDRYVPAVRGMREVVLVVRATDIEHDPRAAVKLARAEVERSRCGASGDPVERVFTVNGVLRPQIDMRAGESQFWRIVNAAADRYIDLEVPGQRLDVVAFDGVPIAYHDPGHPTRDVEHVLLPPAGRVEAIVAAPPGARPSVLRTRCVDTGPDGDPNPGMILADVVSGSGAPTAPSDVQLIPPSRAAVSVVDVERLEHAPPTFTATFTEGNHKFYINGHLFSPDDAPMVRAKVGGFEHWRIVNDTREIHPMHIHQTHFLAFMENDRLIRDPLWLDTVNVPVGGSVDVVMDFTNPVIRGMSVFHCHLLNHEDKGMMAKILFE